MNHRTRDLWLLFFAVAAAILAVPFGMLLQGWLS